MHCIEFTESDVTVVRCSDTETIFRMALTLKSLFRCKTCTLHTSYSTQCILDEPRKDSTHSVYYLLSKIYIYICICWSNYRENELNRWIWTRLLFFQKKDAPFTFIGIRNEKKNRLHCTVPVAIFSITWCIYIEHDFFGLSIQFFVCSDFSFCSLLMNSTNRTKFWIESQHLLHLFDYDSSCGRSIFQYFEMNLTKNNENVRQRNFSNLFWVNWSEHPFSCYSWINERYKFWFG